MESYVIIMKLTDQGIKTVKTANQIIDAAQKVLEGKGGKLTACYVTMGDVDYVAICDAPNDEAVLSFVLSLGATGNVRTTTMKAFKTEVIQKLDITI